MATDTAHPGDLRSVSIDLLVPNVNNPRKEFDKASLRELADTIELHGIIEPIVGRPDPLDKKKIEIVLGERRWRAAKLAKREKVPVVVSELTDVEALELMIIENDQRKDLRPIERARGYKALIDQGVTKEEIAKKVGKSLRTILATLQLLTVIPAVARALDLGLISPGHALLIARLQPDYQIAALDACFHYGSFDRKKHNAADKLEDLVDVEDAEASGVMGEKSLREWIQENINLRLKDVPWDLDDAKLLPSAGPCSTCPKRSKSNPGLFGDLAIDDEDTCFDPECYREKKAAFVEIQLATDRVLVKQSETPGADPKEPIRQLSEKTGHVTPAPDQKILRSGQWLPAKRGSCKSVEFGLIVDGDSVGERKLVCCDQSCKVHKHKLQARAKSDPDTPDVFQVERLNRHKGNIQADRKRLGRRALAIEIVDRVGAPLPIGMLRIVAGAARQARRGDDEQILYLLGIKDYKSSTSKVNDLIEGGSPCVVTKVLVACLLAKNVDSYEDKKEREEMTEAGKAVGIKNPHGILSREDDRVHKLPSCVICGCTKETPCNDQWEGNKRVPCKLKNGAPAYDHACSTSLCQAEFKRREAKAKK